MARTVEEAGLSDVFAESCVVLVEYETDLGEVVFFAVKTMDFGGLATPPSVPPLASAPILLDLSYFLTATVVLATSAPICNAHSWMESALLPTCSLAASTARRLFTALSLLDIISARNVSL